VSGSIRVFGVFLLEAQGPTLMSKSSASTRGQRGGLVAQPEHSTGLDQGLRLMFKLARRRVRC